jgi:hypothetical protein
MRQRVHLQRIAVDHLKPPRIGGGNLGQRGHAARVFLDRKHPPRAFHQQSPRQTTGAGANLQHIAGRQIPG